MTTLDEFIYERQKDFPYATGELSRLLRDFGVAAKTVNREVRKAGLVNILGKSDQQNTNTSGDEVQKLDLYANERLIEALAKSGDCAGIASEECEDIIHLPFKEAKEANYVVVFDPLDGSSNIDVNVTVGTIFGIYRRKSGKGPATKEDFLQKGDNLVAAGYILFGTSTLLVYTTGKGVNGFTLDPSIGEFCLSHPDITLPEESNIYSVNQGYFKRFDRPMQEFIKHCTSGHMTLRYIGSMIADAHRTILYGGLFLYPTMEGRPEGKLRILYECNPVAFLIEQAGGKAICSKTFKPVRSIPVDDLHQRSGVIMGTAHMVDEAVEILKANATVNET